MTYFPVKRNLSLRWSAVNSEPRALVCVKFLTNRYSTYLYNIHVSMLNLQTSMCYTTLSESQNLKNRSLIGKLFEFFLGKVGKHDYLFRGFFITSVGCMYVIHWIDEQLLGYLKLLPTVWAQSSRIKSRNWRSIIN